MALAGLQHIVHQVLSLDENTQEAFAGLNGKSLEASLVNTPLAIRISLKGHGRILNPPARPPMSAWVATLKP